MDVNIKVREFHNLLSCPAAELEDERHGNEMRNSISDALVSYSAPEGSSEDNLHMFDTTYDGDNLEGQLVNGLGKLFDGFIGEDNFELHPHKWIGWSASQAKGLLLNLTLRFPFKNFSSFHRVAIHFR